MLSGIPGFLLYYLPCSVAALVGCSGEGLRVGWEPVGLEQGARPWPHMSHTGCCWRALSASFRNLTQQSLLNELLVFLRVSGAKISEQKSSNNSSQKKKKKKKKKKKRKQKLIKRGLPLNLKFVFNRFHILRLGRGTREERSFQRSAEGKGWEVLGGARPGSTSWKRKQSSGEPPGRAGQGRAAVGLPGKERASRLG